MEIVRMRVYYDFASTLCYLGHRVLTEVDEQIVELGVELEWRPIDLTMAVPWDRGDSFTDEIRTNVHNTGKALGVDVEMPDPWLDSRPASHVALETPSSGAEAHWRREVFDSIFQRRIRELTPDLVELAIELVGPDSLPGEEEESFTSVEKSTQEAIAFGVTGVPSILLDNWLFGGVYDGDSMVAILQQLSEQYRELGASVVN
jgi:predicted DsbA family dithiol-disulfide isomerase